MAISAKRFISFFLSNKLAIIEGLTCILSFSLSFPKGFSAYTLGVWFGMCILLSIGHWRENISEALANRKSWSSFALLLLFVLGLISAFYATNSEAVFHRLFNARFPIFCIPLGVVLANVRVPFVRILKSYIFGVTCFVLYSYIMVTFMMNNNHFLEAFNGNDWSGLTHLFGDVVNRAYTNTNVVLAVLSTACLLLFKQVERRYFWIYGIAIALMLSFLFINTSRMVLASAMAVSFVGVLTFSFSNKRLFGWSCLVFAVLCGLIFFTDNRISRSFITILNSFTDGTVSFSDPRFMIWKAGWAIDPHTFLWGYGENNVDPYLFQEYERMGWAEGIAWHYLCHNQYLELYLELGLPGLLAFIGAMVFAPIGVEKVYRKFFYLLVLFFALIMFTECYISRTAGALFFAFFLSVVSMSVGADTHIPVSEKMMDARSKLGILLVAGTLSTVLLFTIFYAKKSTETYTLSKGEDIVVKGEEHNGHPVYRLDAYSRVSTGDSNAFSYYVFFIARNHEQKVRFDVDCYISENFNGSWAIIANLDERHQMRQSCFYDNKLKGTWQTLTLELPAGDNFVHLDICKEGVNDFSTLTGYVLYSNPRWSVIK